VTFDATTAAGNVVTYIVKRYKTDTPALKTVLGSVAPVLDKVEGYIFDDTEELRNAQFTYEVIARYDDENSTERGRSVNVVVVNTAPVANNNTYSMTKGDPPLVVAARGVLTNDTDVDSPSLTAAYVNASGPSSGTLVFNSDGSFTYTPPSSGSFPITVTFRYKANDVDPSRSSNEATVTITVLKK
jgi:hypothetical protein